MSVECRCGSDKFNIPSTRRPSDTISCARCGATGRYGDVMRTAGSQAKAAVEKQLKDAFKKAGFKLK
ncbi:TPA: ECs_2282 family putative zinc-binding protein [Stenotrophomonas maltophilia]